MVNADPAHRRRRRRRGCRTRAQAATSATSRWRTRCSRTPAPPRTATCTRCSAPARPSSSRPTRGSAEHTGERAGEGAAAGRLRRHRDPLRERRRHLQRRHGHPARPAPGRAGRLRRFPGAVRGEVRRSGDQPRLSRAVNDVNGNPITDPTGNPGFPGLRRDVGGEHARLRRADAGVRHPDHVRLHLGRARQPQRQRRIRPG